MVEEEQPIVPGDLVETRGGRLSLHTATTSLSLDWEITHIMTDTEVGLVIAVTSDTKCATALVACGGTFGWRECGRLKKAGTKITWSVSLGEGKP